MLAEASLRLDYDSNIQCWDDGELNTHTFVISWAQRLSSKCKGER